MIEPIPNASRSLAAAQRQPSEASLTAAAVAEAAATEIELDSDRLFGRTRRLVIVHHGERYCLQVTRAGKLLLTK